METAELVDLSVPLRTGTPVFPGDPQVRVEPALTASRDGVNVQRLHLGSQSGTHVDAPFHLDDAWPRLDALPLSRFTGPVEVMDARGHAPHAAIGPAALPAGLRPGAVLLVWTGWSEHWATGRYFAHPYLAPETAAAVVAAGVRTVGIDAPSVDRTPPPGEPDGGDLAAHRALLGADGVIAENLANLARVAAARAAGRAVEAFLFPLSLAADGAPVRAVARVTSGR
nr:cyclase family protein [Actinomadura atramentaria]